MRAPYLVFRPGKYIFGVAGVINNDFFNIIAIYVVKRMRAPEPDEKKNKNDNDTKHNNYNFLFHERYLLFQFGFKRLTSEELLLTPFYLMNIVIENSVLIHGNPLL